MYRTVESCCAPDANITSYVTYTAVLKLIFFQERKKFKICEVSSAGKWNAQSWVCLASSFSFLVPSPEDALCLYVHPGAAFSSCGSQLHGSFL